MDTDTTSHEGQQPIEQTENNGQTTKPKGRNNTKMAASTAEDTRNGTNGANNSENKPARERKLGLLPTATEEKAVTYLGKVVGEVTWATLPIRALFSANADGSHPYIKLSKSSFEDLVTEEVTTGVPPKTQQKFYRVKLQ